MGANFLRILPSDLSSCFLCAILRCMKVRHKNLREAARRLRQLGASYGEIKTKTGVAKSTLSYWLKDILLNSGARKKLYTKQVELLSRGPKSQKERRAREVERIGEAAEQEIILPLSPETFRLMGAALYWGEGNKGKMAQITNSDPHLILFAVKWIEHILGVPSMKLSASLNIYPQQNERHIKQFWSDLTKIPFENFRKSYVKPLSKNYKKNNLYYGTIKIYIPKSANLQHQIFGWIRAATKSVAPDVQLIQKRWGSLAKTPRPVNL